MRKLSTVVINNKRCNIRCLIANDFYKLKSKTLPSVSFTSRQNLYHKGDAYPMVLDWDSQFTLLQPYLTKESCLKIALTSVAGSLPLTSCRAPPNAETAIPPKFILL